MFLVQCPVCRGRMIIHPDEVKKEVRCSRPGCPGRFLALSASKLTSATPPHLPPQTGPLNTKLTAPHYCPSCDAFFDRAFGYRRTTVRHRKVAAPPQPECRLDVYATIYLCPVCPPGNQALLETPSYACEALNECPVCLNEFEAPAIHVLHERVGDHFEGEIFRFDCPSCGETLQTDTCRQGQSNAGTRVACLFCRQVITIPPIGVSPLERVLS